MAKSTSFTLNGKKVKVAGDPARMLVDVLRYQLGLTGTKLGCGAALCGAQVTEYVGYGSLSVRRG